MHACSTFTYFTGRVPRLNATVHMLRTCLVCTCQLCASCTCDHRERKRGLELSVSRTPQQEAEENAILEQAATIQAARKAEQAQLQAQRKAAAPPPPGFTPCTISSLYALCSMMLDIHTYNQQGTVCMPCRHGTGSTQPAWKRSNNQLSECVLTCLMNGAPLASSVMSCISVAPTLSQLCNYTPHTNAKQPQLLHDPQTKPASAPYCKIPCHPQCSFPNTTQYRHMLIHDRTPTT